VRRRELIAGLVAVTIVVAPAVAASQTTPQELAVKLTPAQRQIYDDYRRVREAFEAKLRGYWARVDAKRDARRAKHMLAQPLSTEDYVAEQPPKYAGPELPAEIAKLVVEVMPPTPARPLPEVSDFLANAKAQYGFVPAPTTELDFKRRYAREALAVGLSKDQVVRIYALETGGQGTYDMQSGINPGTKQGRPISSALGYAQLLNGNSVSELVKHGTRFAQRLIGMAAQPGTPPARAAGLRDKATIVRRMLRAARTGGFRVATMRRAIPIAWASFCA